MKYSCIIIEDEYPAQEKLKDFISQMPVLELKGIFDNAIEAMDHLSSNNTNLIFLDIEMPKISGINFLKSLSKTPQVILVTAFEKYALESYEYNVTDYLLKPYSFERFVKSVEKFMKNNKSSVHEMELNYDGNLIFIKSGSIIEKVKIDDICYVQGLKDYQMIITTNSKILTLQNFNELGKVLNEPHFVRIHKSYMVAVSKIELIERNRVKIKDLYLPVSRTYREHFFEIIKNNKHLF